MPRVIRYGQKPQKNQKAQWSDEEILRAYWEMEEQVTGCPSPMKRAELALRIPELNPIPQSNPHEK